MFLDLWTTATTCDFTLGESKTDLDKYTKLGTCDTLELGLRHLAGFVYEQRTGDKAGAARIRGLHPPGSGVDLAPEWLVAEATTFSKAEFQRAKRVESELERRREWRPKGDAKGNQKGNKGAKGDKDKGKQGKGAQLQG